MERVVDDGIISGIGLILLEKNGLYLSFRDSCDGLVVEDFASFDDRNGTLDRNYLTRVLIFEILGPGLEDLGREFPAFILLEGFGCHLDLIGETEDVNDILVSVVADGAEKGCDRELLLAVDVGVHDIVDVCSELDP